ncbi:MAG TPA: SAM-dependent methyltransferase [Streptosporangiaceae bacterium]
MGRSATAGEPVPFDTSVANHARVYNYLLGGKDNYEADRAAGDAAIQAYPATVYAARANRAFLARVVSFLAKDEGIRQFLDIGTGIPTANNTHEVAQSVAPESRIVYVDNDPVVLAHARALLTSSPEGATAYLDADLRDPEKILEHAAGALDFSQPIAIMLIALLHVIGDEDNPHESVARLVGAVPSGSYLALSHVASDIEPEKVADAMGRLGRLGNRPGRARSHAEVARFFGEMDLVEPGLVEVPQWRARPERSVAMWGGVGRKR